MDKQQLLDAVKQASDSWKNAFNVGDASGCGAQYEEDAIIEAKPFGTFQGRSKITDFWQYIIDEGYSDVTYINPQFKPLDEKTVLLKSDWQMNKASGIITKELWVLQSDGTAKLKEDAFEVLEKYDTE